VDARSAPVGLFRPNAFGLYTAGNAAEWMEDCWNQRTVARRTTDRPGQTATARFAFSGEGRSPDKALAVLSPARFRYDGEFGTKLTVAEGARLD
jgi:formylglycine-generating enzyme required for sulfatase activity